MSHRVAVLWPPVLLAAAVEAPALQAPFMRRLGGAVARLRGQQSAFRRRAAAQLAACVLLLAFLGVQLLGTRCLMFDGAPGLPNRPVNATLVMYAVNNPDDPLAATNLGHFVRHEATHAAAAAAAAGAVAIVLLLPQRAAHLALDLPALPHSMELVLYGNDSLGACGGATPAAAGGDPTPPSASTGWGPFGFYLASTPGVAHRFRHFVFLTSEASGPHMPSYAPARMHWTQALTGKLAGGASRPRGGGAPVKLVGSVLSCEEARIWDAQAGGPAVRRVPFLLPEGPVATDREGLALLLRDPEVFRCHASRAAARYHSAAGASLAVLGAGYGLDCLMWRYQEVDWRDESAWACNGRLPPTGERTQGGTSVDPLEVLFVPLASRQLALRRPSAVRAHKFTTWAREVPRGNASAVLGNEHFAESQRRADIAALELMARGERCFDEQAYLKAYPDLHALPTTPGSLWRHFTTTGMREHRQGHWRCTAPTELAASLARPTLQAVEQLAAAVPGLPACEGGIAALWAAMGVKPRACQHSTQPAAAAGEGGEP